MVLESTDESIYREEAKARLSWSQDNNLSLSISNDMIVDYRRQQGGDAEDEFTDPL